MALGSVWARLRGNGQPSLARSTALRLFGFATWIPVIAMFNLHVAELTFVDGASMYPLINDDKDSTLRRDVILNWKWSPQENLERGMVVTLRSPLHPETIAVKRVVALENDVIKTKAPHPLPTVRVPQGHVWVEDSDLVFAQSTTTNDGSTTAASDFAPSPEHRHAAWTGRRSESSRSKASDQNMTAQDVEAEGRPPYLHAMIAGGIGGSTGDLLMHSLDTVKTRQQGDPHVPSKYTSLGQSYYTIWRQEGIRRGLYGGWVPALGGSFPGTVMFFGTYEWSKRFFIDHGVQQHISYLTAGFLGDLAASIVYVPSEVLKTRLQLQGRYNNPHFTSGYNYRGTVDAARTIVRAEGASALFYGYKATLYRDLPFSALQFMFWEQFTTWARKYKQSRDIGVSLELLTGAAAGGLAGVITCPLDVVKTRLQTQVNTPTESRHPKDHHASSQVRHISTSSPSTHRPRPGAIPLDTSSVFTGLRVIYRTEGVAGWFRGVGPRGVWTFIQSGCMLFLYQRLLRQLEVLMPVELEEM
ncbi:mitochondrial carrier domain-containing protein [Fusarium redolens]|uniref:Mitochondrial carrier domain-containing protein n=1 Tax=Fusarium redolens TaxID=48865 RepID=A0A9P9K5N1_FUSRE|nr:mitochondrial carrier domain-containing protein [Fusarium redolens]KAH7248848.1 mitochondrial carrier domain-containing protein [Fusarium redolens]